MISNGTFTIRKNSNTCPSIKRSNKINKRKEVSSSTFVFN